jgi:hypothetical protein
VEMTSFLIHNRSMSKKSYCLIISSASLYSSDHTSTERQGLYSEMVSLLVRDQEPKLSRETLSQGGGPGPVDETPRQDAGPAFALPLF